MQIRFDGQTVVVGGARWGIGRRISELFLESGGRVYCCDKHAEGLEELEKLGARTRMLDLTDAVATNDWVSSIENETGAAVGILVNNAGGFGISKPGEFTDVTDEIWDATMSINLRTAVTLSRAVVPGMKQAGGGRIINISSGAGLAASGTRNHAYTSAKHAVVGLTRQMAFGLGQYGITVNSVAPGFVLSAPSPQAYWNSKTEREKDEHLNSVYMRRHGVVEDIAPSVLFLASAQASWITGQVIAVNGGRAV
jgi:3-oxoacyl-[acyl-carrier protein] reductase